jgi:hypothetical protein
MPAHTIEDHFVKYSERHQSYYLVVVIRDNQSNTLFKIHFDTAMKCFPQAMKRYLLNQPNLLEQHNKLVQIKVQRCGIPFNDDELQPPQEAKWYDDTDDEEEDKKPPAKLNMAFLGNIKRHEHDQRGYLMIDGRSDTCSIGGNAWVIMYLSDKYVDVNGFSLSHTMRDIRIGGGITATDLPDGTTILLKMNEASLLGRDGASLLSIAQSEANSVHFETTPRKLGGFPHIEVDGVIIPLITIRGLYQIKI